MNLVCHPVVYGLMWLATGLNFFVAIISWRAHRRNLARWNKICENTYAMAVAQKETMGCQKKNYSKS